MVNRTPVTSRNLVSVGWENDVLEIEFKANRVYLYHGVPASVYHQLMQASDKNAFFLSEIRDRYPMGRL